jgi:FkbM family methyltransferase
MSMQTELRDQRGRVEHWESRLVFEYFQKRSQGFFVEVGANRPRTLSQTWFLEEQGWKGILVEPNPKLCQLLREQRIHSQVFEMALCSPADVGEADLYLAYGSGHSAIKPEPGAVLTGERIRVAMRTLDWVLEEGRPGEIDFISIDVEGMELEVLRGFDLARWRPKLLFIEDIFVNHQKHSYLKSHGYKLIRRTGYNNWYVPQQTPASLFSASTLLELFTLTRKFWLNPLYEPLRRRWKERHFRPPLKANRPGFGR